MADANVKEITGSVFETEVIGSDIPVIVDFWAPWCGPCRAMAPVFSQLADKFEGKVKFIKVNVDDNPDVASTYRIMNIPTLLIFKKGEIAEKIIGMRSGDAIADLLNKTL
ncbi:MAG: thioredoxin [Clostridia bacterium]